MGKPDTAESSADARDPTTSLARRAAVLLRAGFEQGAQSLSDCAQQKFGGDQSSAIWYNADMTAKALKEVMQRVESWPESAQEELAEIAKEIEAGMQSGVYHATPAELTGIDRGLKAAREGRFATKEQAEAVFSKYRGT